MASTRTLAVLLLGVTAAVACAGTEPPVPPPAGSIWATSDLYTYYFGIIEVWPELPGSAEPVLVDNDHAGIRISYNGGPGDFYVYVGPFSLIGGVLYDPNTAFLYGNASTAFDVGPGGLPAGFEFTGAEPNSTFYNLEQNQVPGMIFLGYEAPGTAPRLVEWNPGDPAKFANFDNAWLQVDLIDMRWAPDWASVDQMVSLNDPNVPADFSLFQYGSPPTPYMSTFWGGIDSDDRLYFSSGGHDHFNWGFTMPGLYEMDIQVSTFVVPQVGDFNCDDRVDFADINPFVDALTNPTQYAQDYPDCPLDVVGDVNESGAFGFDDINPFVDLLLAQP